MARIRIPFVGPEYEARSSNQSAQRLINWYVEATEQGGKTDFTLYPTPGLTKIITLGDGPVRGSVEVNGGHEYVVSGNEVHRVSPDLTHVKVGNIGTSRGIIGLAYNGDQVIIVDGKRGYIVDTRTNKLEQITDPDFPNGVTWAWYLDRYFIVGGDDTGRFYISELADGKKWVGTEYANAEGDPDPLIAGIVNHRELFLFGTNSFEIWFNTGDATFPIERSGNAFGETGCAAPQSLCKFAGDLLWLGKDRDGDGIVWRMNGYNPQRVSTHALEWAISQYKKIDDAIAFIYQMNGSAWYVLHFPSADRTWAYNINGNYWHEWLAFDAKTGLFHRHRSNCHFMLGRKHIVGDWENGNLYHLDPKVYTDDGQTIKRVRTVNADDAELRRVFYSSLQVDLQAGIGLAVGQGSDPVMMLRWSNDGGHTWSNTRVASMGAMGQYGARCIWNRLGNGRDRVWELSVTDPVNAVVLGAVLIGEVGES